MEWFCQQVVRGGVLLEKRIFTPPLSEFPHIEEMSVNCPVLRRPVLLRVHHNNESLQRPMAVSLTFEMKDDPGFDPECKEVVYKLSETATRVATGKSAAQEHPPGGANRQEVMPGRKDDSTSGSRTSARAPVPDIWISLGGETVSCGGVEFHTWRMHGSWFSGEPIVFAQFRAIDQSNSVTTEPGRDLEWMYGRLKKEMSSVEEKSEDSSVHMTGTLPGIKPSVFCRLRYEGATDKFARPKVRTMELMIPGTARESLEKGWSKDE
jgi:hypothetical protein